jgi:signal-transduction protein with cAMP-binding, CBS, and nucleotidyltransferase domain
MYEQLTNFLGRFVQLTDEEFSHLKKQLVLREFKKKEIITKEGETEQYLYFINKGLIHQYFHKGKEVVTTDLVCAGTITGSVTSFLSRKPSHYFLEALEPTEAWTMSRHSLDVLYNTDVKWQRFGRILITHFLLQQEWHLLDNIRYSIRERFVQFGQQFPDMLKRVPQRRLASYLNMKPETFSRLKPLLNIKQKEPASAMRKKK